MSKEEKGREKRDYFFKFAKNMLKIHVRNRHIVMLYLHVKICFMIYFR